MKNTPQSRLDEFIRLNFKRKKEFAEIMQMRDSDLSKYTANGESVFQTKNKINQLEKLGLNIVWYLHGEGKMMKSDSLTINHNGTGVPYYPSDITASIVRSFNDTPMEPDFYIDFKPFNDCSAYFTVFGDSMYPRYASGEIVAVKQVFNLDIIWWGEAYLVITDETADNMRTIKLMYPNEDNHDLVNLRASNPNYKGETKILKTSIIALFLVKGKITRNLM